MSRQDRYEAQPCVTGCGRPGRYHRKTMCHPCYEAMRRARGGRLSPEDRFFLRVAGESDDGCWLWRGPFGVGGYGVFCINYERIQAHRWSYELLRAEIPAGLVIDHLCRNPRCVNPWHLEPVTIAENTRRGESPMTVASRTNTCQRGHSLTDAIVVKSGPQKGRRNCRTCAHERWAAKSADPAFRARHAARQRAYKAARGAR